MLLIPLLCLYFFISFCLFSGIVLNSTLVFFGWYAEMKKDFGSYLLTVLLANLMLYFVFYIIMKLMNGERLLLEPLLYSILTLCLAAPAGYFFYSNVTSWQVSCVLKLYFLAVFSTSLFAVHINRI